MPRLVRVPGSAEEQTDERGEENDDIDHRYPRLIFNIELFERQTPRVFDKNPSYKVENDTYHSPHSSGDQSITHGRIRQAFHIQPSCNRIQHQIV